MRPFRGAVVLGALAVLLAADTQARAAWNNVFQVSCFFRHRRQTVVQYAPAYQPAVVAAAPACPAPCPPQPICTTRYVQRCYYQPVTTYTRRTYYEPVTTYKTSYYCEPVCSYRYSCYYDPCTCSYRQVATPVTSYRLRTRRDPVTTYLQRCQMVPVTSYQLKTCYEPVTTCCTPTVAAAPPCPPNPCPPAATISPPAIGEQQVPQPPPLPHQSQRPPAVGEQVYPNGNSRRRYPDETQPPPMNGAHDSSFRQPPAPPRVRLDKIVSLPDHDLEGRVVGGERRDPRPGARLLFVSTDRRESQQSVTADERGNFRATLAEGEWLVYVRNREGTPVFQTKIAVSARETRPVTLLVSR